MSIYIEPRPSWRLIVPIILGIVVFGIVYQYSWVGSNTFTATSTLLLTAAPPAAQSFDVVTPPPVGAGAYRTYILDGGILARVLEDRGEAAGDAADLRRALNVTVENQQVSSIIRISLTDPDPERAADIVNAVARHTVTWDAERGRRSLEAGVNGLAAAADNLRQRRAAEAAAGADTSTTEALLERQEEELEAARARLAETIVVPLIDVLREVPPPAEPDPKNAVRNGLIGGVAAGLIVFVLQLLFRALRAPPSTATAPTAGPAPAQPAPKNGKQKKRRN